MNLVTRPPHIRNNLCHEVMADQTPGIGTLSKSPDQIADMLIANQFTVGDYSSMTPREKGAIRACIKSALGIGFDQAVNAGKKPYADAQEMLDAALAFENTLPHGMNVSRQKSELYPWGWCYTDFKLQERYRQYYIANKAKKQEAV